MTCRPGNGNAVPRSDTKRPLIRITCHCGAEAGNAGGGSQVVRGCCVQALNPQRDQRPGSIGEAAAGRCGSLGETTATSGKLRQRQPVDTAAAKPRHRGTRPPSSGPLGRRHPDRRKALVVAVPSLQLATSPPVARSTKAALKAFAHCAPVQVRSDATASSVLSLAIGGRARRTIRHGATRQRRQTVSEVSTHSGDVQPNTLHVSWRIVPGPDAGALASWRSSDRGIVQQWRTLGFGLGKLPEHRETAATRAAAAPPPQAKEDEMAMAGSMGGFAGVRRRQKRGPCMLHGQ